MARRRSSIPTRACPSEGWGQPIHQRRVHRHSEAAWRDDQHGPHKGRYMDNIFVERLWRSLKYEEVYLNAYATVAEAKIGVGAWLSFYNDERPHQSLGYRTPRQIYQEGLWICGRSAPPTGCASPTSRASSESGEMLAFDHIPTGATTNTRFNIDEVNSSLIKPAVVLTAIGADLVTGRATP